MNYRLTSVNMTCDYKLCKRDKLTNDHHSTAAHRTASAGYSLYDANHTHQPRIEGFEYLNWSTTGLCLHLCDCEIWGFYCFFARQPTAQMRAAFMCCGRTLFTFSWVIHAPQHTGHKEYQFTNETKLYCHAIFCHKWFKSNMLTKDFWFCTRHNGSSVLFWNTTP